MKKKQETKACMEKANLWKSASRETKAKKTFH